MSKAARWRKKSQREKQRLGSDDPHSFHRECTERGSRVKALRFAPMNPQRTRP